MSGKYLNRMLNIIIRVQDNLKNRNSYSLSYRIILIDPTHYLRIQFPHMEYLNIKVAM